MGCRYTYWIPIMSSVFNRAVKMLGIVLSNKVSNTIAFRRYGVTAPVTLTTSPGASSSTVQNDDNVRRGQKKTRDLSL